MNPSSGRFKNADLLVRIPSFLVMENGRPKIGTVPKKIIIDNNYTTVSDITAIYVKEKDGKETARAGIGLDFAMRNDLDNGEVKQHYPSALYDYPVDKNGNVDKSNWGPQSVYYTADQINNLYDKWTPTTGISGNNNEINVLYGKGNIRIDDYARKQGKDRAFRIGMSSLAPSNQPLDYAKHIKETDIASAAYKKAKQAKRELAFEADTIPDFVPDQTAEAADLDTMPEIP